MTGLWLIFYDLLPEKEAEYLTWFHDVHIPEKLAREGYTWAAHYVAEGGGDQGRNRYAALFGGEDSSVFYNPSPEQIKPNQPPETRAMMAIRANPEMFILTREWSRDQAGPKTESATTITANNLEVTSFDVEPANQALSSSLIQELWPTLREGEGFQALHKFLSSTGSPRHLTLVESEAGTAQQTEAKFTGERLWPV
jgi:hypothetical protein